jgi:hypothetical protein
MKTYINPALIDAHNAQLQLEQLEGVKLKRLGVFEAYGRFLLICAAGVATLMVGFGLMMWLMTPPVAAQGDEYITTYEIAEVIVRQDEPEIFQTETSAGGLPSISESLSEIHSNITRTDRDKTERATTPDITSQFDTNTEVTSADESTLPTDQFVVFRYYLLESGEGAVHTGLKYSANNFERPFYQYCYWIEAEESSDLLTRLSLGDKDMGQPISWSENEMVERYKQHCQFMQD